jgi:large subunit ribosomal protein L18e
LRRVGTTNLVLRKYKRRIEKLKGRIWKIVAQKMVTGGRKRIVVNIGKFNRFGSEELLVIPGKVLGGGKLRKAVNVLAISYSKKAYEEIIKNKGNAYLLTSPNVSTIVEKYDKKTLVT